MEDVNRSTSQPQQQPEAQRGAYLANGNLTIDPRLKKFDKTSIFAVGGNSRVDLVANSESGDSEDSDEGDSDIISDHIGHIGTWQLFWAIIMCFFQFPTTFHIFCLVFQVSLNFDLKHKVKFAALQLLIVSLHFVHLVALIELVGIRIRLENRDGMLSAH